ncbi:MAG: hypothetical protein IT285_08515 [Bdellovibrionales bacterium]|nr:hypothetical protein [Bdellovibrionales bacterium]
MLRESRNAAAEFQRLADCVRGGLLPSPSDWEALEGLPGNWGAFLGRAVRELRASGGEVLPTLNRASALAVEEERSLWSAREKAGQATAQAGALVVLTPLTGMALYWLVPELDRALFAWTTACALATALSVGGAAWLLATADRARWGGAKGLERQWRALLACAGERLAARVRGGTPPDLAWEDVHAALSARDLDLGAIWGASIWGETGPSIRMKAPMVQACVSLPGRLRAAARVSVMEGTPCLERLESGLEAFRRETEGAVARELARLPVRALQPLFLCQAPALVALLAGAMLAAFLGPGVLPDSSGGL